MMISARDREREWENHRNKNSGLGAFYILVSLFLRGEHLSKPYGENVCLDIMVQFLLNFLWLYSHVHWGCLSLWVNLIVTGSVVGVTHHVSSFTICIKHVRPKWNQIPMNEVVFFPHFSAIQTVPIWSRQLRVLVGSDTFLSLERMNWINKVQAQVNNSHLL